MKFVINHEQLAGSFRCLELLESVVELVADVFDLEGFLEDEQLRLGFAFEVFEDAHVNLTVIYFYCCRG